MNTKLSLLLLLLALGPGCSCGPKGPTAPSTGAADLPGGSGGISFDDLRFSARLGKVMVPAAQTGNVDLVDPASLEVTKLGGFSGMVRADSVDEANGLLYAIDRSTHKLNVVDPSAKALVGSVNLLANGPDYVRFSAPTSEIWVTDPSGTQIEVLSLGANGIPEHQAFIATPGGPEGLLIDGTRKRAYVQASGNIAVVDLAQRKVVATWSTDCNASHGIPVMDEERGLLFAGCLTAEVSVLDAKADGKKLGSYSLSSFGETILGYSPSLRHFYLRSDPGTEVAVLGIRGSGKPERLGSFEAANRGHGLTADDKGNVFICDADKGRIQRFQDTFPATAP